MFSSKFKYSSLILFLAVVVMFYSTALPFSAAVDPTTASDVLIPNSEFDYYELITVPAEYFSSSEFQLSFVLTGVVGRVFYPNGTYDVLSNSDIYLEFGDFEYYPANDSLQYFVYDELLYQIDSFSSFVVVYNAYIPFDFCMPIRSRIHPIVNTFGFGFGCIYSFPFYDSVALGSFTLSDVLSGDFSYLYKAVHDYESKVISLYPSGVVGFSPMTFDVIGSLGFEYLELFPLFEGLGYDLSEIRSLPVAEYRFTNRSFDYNQDYFAFKPSSSISIEFGQVLGNTASSSLFIPYFSFTDCDVYVRKELADLVPVYIDKIVNPTPESAAEVERLEQELEEISEQLRQDASDLEVEKPDISDSVENLPSEVIEGMGEASETVLSPLMTIDLIATLFSVLFGVVALKLILFGSGTA